GSPVLRVLAAAVVLAAVSACGPDDSSPDSPSATAAQSSDPTATPKQPSATETKKAAPVADPELAVTPPGPMKDPVETADVLIFNQKPLSDSLIKRIKKVKNVAAMETFGLGNVVIENRALNVAAV